MSETPTEFNVRIYGLFIHEGALLVSESQAINKKSSHRHHHSVSKHEIGN